MVNYVHVYIHHVWVCTFSFFDKLAKLIYFQVTCRKSKSCLKIRNTNHLYEHFQSMVRLGSPGARSLAGYGQAEKSANNKNWIKDKETRKLSI